MIRKAIIQYQPNSVYIRFHNRKLFIWTDPQDPNQRVGIEFQRLLEKGEDPEKPTAGVKMVNPKVKATFMPLSPMSSQYLMYGLMAFQSLMQLKHRLIKKTEHDKDGHLKDISVGDIVVDKAGLVLKIRSDDDQYYPKWPWVDLKESLPEEGVEVECRYDYEGVERNTYTTEGWLKEPESGAQYTHWRLISPQRYLSYKDIDRFATWEESFKWLHDNDELPDLNSHY